jgi:hypothetical protein
MKTYKIIMCWIAVAQMTQIVSLAAPPLDHVEVSGQVCDPKYIGIPGAIISVVSLEARQKPVYSDNQGRFTFRVPTNETSKWYVEIYWNKDIMFRNEMRQLRIKNEDSNFGPAWAEALQTGGRVELEPIILGK